MNPIKLSDLKNKAIEGKEFTGFQDTAHSDKMDVYPSMIQYNKEGVIVAGMLFYSTYPKLTFCRLLSVFNEPDMGSCVSLGRGVNIGENCTIGGRGFGYILDSNGKNIPVPHLGTVIIEQGVTIHNSVNIDRGVIGATIIGENTKIDSLVHVAHNVRIGKNCLIIAGSIIGGSSVIGDNTVIGMGANIKNKVTIGKDCLIGAGAVVLKDVPDGETWAGCPAKKLK